MLTYDYYCEKCKSTVERRVKGEEAHRQRCDSCDALLVRLMPAPYGTVRGPAVPRRG